MDAWKRFHRAIVRERLEEMESDELSQKAVRRDLYLAELDNECLRNQLYELEETIVQLKEKLAKSQQDLKDAQTVAKFSRKKYDDYVLRFSMQLVKKRRWPRMLNLKMQPGALCTLERPFFVLLEIKSSRLLSDCESKSDGFDQNAVEHAFAQVIQITSPRTVDQALQRPPMTFNYLRRI